MGAANACLQSIYLTVASHVTRNAGRREYEAAVLLETQQRNNYKLKQLQI